MESASPSRFVRDTSVASLGGGRYRGVMSRAWWIVRGPNGGYVAAMIYRALEAEVADPARTPRSLTIHYLRPPEEGDVEVAVTAERAGRTVTTLSARMTQAGKLLALALAAFGTGRAADGSFDDASFPEVADPGALPDHPPPDHVPLQAQYVERWAIGHPPVEGAPLPGAEVGGWIRLADPSPIDFALVVAFTDAWPPAAFTRLGRHDPVSTVDLTIHFREAPPRSDDWCLVRFRSRKSHDGFLDEEGEVWSRDGRLLAQSRQLAVVLPQPPGA